MAKYQALVTTVDAVQLKYPMTMETPSGVVRASSGDWLVTLPDGSQTFLGQDTFAQNYVELPTVTDTSKMTSTTVTVPT